MKEKLTTLRREEKCLGLAVVDDHDVAVAAVVIFEVLLVVVDTVVIAPVVPSRCYYCFSYWCRSR